MPHTYKFKVKFKDGTSYEQNDEDVSVLFGPEKNCFSDVVNRQDEMETFSLTNGAHTYTVNLTNGIFEIDNVPFLLHEYSLPLENFRVIYFRTTDVTRVVGENGIVDTRYSFYKLGWQAVNKLTNKNEEHLIYIH